MAALSGDPLLQVPLPHTEGAADVTVGMEGKEGFLLSKVLNSRADYRMACLGQTDELICYDVIHPTQYVFHEDTETCTPVYTEYREDYDALNIELPDGYLYFLPIINWGKYREENGRLLMPVSVRMNHAVADGYLIANVFRLLEKEMAGFVRRA